MRDQTTLAPVQRLFESYSVRLPAFLIAILTVLSFTPGLGAHAATLSRVTLVVSDIERSVTFYERLGLTKTSDESRSTAAEVHGLNDLPLTADPTRSRVVVMKGDGQSSEIALLWYDRPPLASARTNLMGLGTGDVIIGLIVPDLQAAYSALDRLGARIEKGPNGFTAASAGVRLYAYDPDGHMVELSQGGR